MMPKILADGLHSLKRKWQEKNPGKTAPKFTPREQMIEGMRYVTPEHYIVQDHDVVKLPETKAVLVRIMDQSGSMHGRPQELIKIFYKNMIDMLKKKYKTLEVINIGFNHDQALEMTEKQFFGNFMNGGDSYILGYKKAIEVLSRDKYKDYDHYGLIAGDFQSRGGQDVDDALAEFYELLNWGGAIQTVLNGDVAAEPLIGSTKAFANDNKWSDFATLDDTMESRIDILKKFFGKKPKNQD